MGTLLTKSDKMELQLSVRMTQYNCTVSHKNQ